MNWKMASNSIASCLISSWMWVAMTASIHGQEKSIPSRENGKASAYFANAADYQNAGAFELAAEEWEKLLMEFPNESQSSTAWHHLGICSLRRTEPNRQRAIEAFRQALVDRESELREESLINLAWALLSQSQEQNADSKQHKQLLTEARSVLTEFLKLFSDGAYLDQAIFYLAETEHSLGNHRKAIDQYKSFLGNRQLGKSPLRPDVLYGLAVAYEEQKQASEAERRYEEFLTDFSNHSLASEVRLRLSELLAKRNSESRAFEILSELADSTDARILDLALLRRGALGLKLDRVEQAVSDYRSVWDRHIRNSRDTVSGNLDSNRADAHTDAHLSDATAAIDGEAILSDAAHGLASALMLQDKHQEASQMLTMSIAAVKSRDRLTVLQLDLADALLAQSERKSDARLLYEKIATENPDSPLAAKAAYNVAYMALEADQPVVAQQWSERFLNRYPKDPLRSDVAYIAAESLLRQGLHSGAVLAFSKLIAAERENPNNAFWRLRRGMALFLEGEYSQAAEDMQELMSVLSEKSQMAEAYYISGASHLYLEQSKLATEQLEASYAADKNWEKADEALIILGEAYQRSGNLKSAISAYNRLLKDIPESRLKSQTLYKLAQATAASGDLSSALRQYRSLVNDSQAASFHNFSIYGAAWCLMQQEEFQEALNELEPLLAKNLQDSIGLEARLAEGICLRNLGRTKQSISSLQQFIGGQPSGQSLANGLYEMALALAANQQTDEANKMLERIIAEVHEYPAVDKVLYELAWNYQERGEVTQATEKFKALVQRHPASPLAAEARYMVAQYDYDAGRYDLAIDGYKSIIDSTIDKEILEKSLYKLGWSLFQSQRIDEAAIILDRQINQFKNGALAVDGMFMRAECDFKQDRFEEAFTGFQRARDALERQVSQDTVSPQVKTLIYLHGAQCLRELGRWNESSQWLKVIIEKQPGSPYLPTAIYELGFCKQNMGKTDEAIQHYSEVASNYRSEVAARARFMLGEIHFSRKDFVKAIPEFQRVMYGFGGDKAPEEIKKWQAKSAFEAARCSEALIQTLDGNARKKIVETTIEFYKFLLDNHSEEGELTAQAQSRLGELQKLR